MKIHLKIGILMEKHNLTNQSLADLSGVPIGTVSGIRSGKIASPSFESICAIMRAMGESVDSLFDVSTSRQTVQEAPKSVDMDAQQRQTILEQATKAAAQAATLEARDASISTYQSQIATIQSELQCAHKRALRQQMALVVLVVAIIALAIVYIWDVRNLHSGLTAYFNAPQK